MAQNITWLGNEYTGVGFVALPKTGGGEARYDDASVTTAEAADVASGKVFLASDGTITTGTASGGGSSSWTKVAETSYQVSTTGTTATTVATWTTGHREIATSEKFIYIRIRDTAGKRAGYFYGSDNFFILNPTLPSVSTTSVRSVERVNSDGTYGNSTYASTTGYGVYADTIYYDGRLRIRVRYSSSISLTIDGIYKVEVYLLDPAGGIPIFE